MPQSAELLIIASARFTAPKQLRSMVGNGTDMDFPYDEK
jgi:hypothetical protein